MDLNNDQIKRIEALVNSVIFANKPVKTYYLEDYSNMEYRAKLDLAKPRLVEIEDVDLCACCAPHVKSTIECLPESDLHLLRDAKSKNHNQCHCHLYNRPA